MYRLCVFVSLLLISTLGFAQQGSSIKIIGRIPGAQDSNLYAIQVGAFRLSANAERAFERLKNASMNPVYERYRDFTRVMIAGVKARDVPFYLEEIKKAGFSEVYIKIDTREYAAPEPPVAPVRQTVPDPPVAPREQAAVELPISTAAVPSPALREIGYRSVKVGETKSLADIASSRNVVAWRSSTPSAISVDANGNITGLAIGNGYISINDAEYISVAVVPSESLYLVPESQEALLPPESNAMNNSSSMTEYRTEPTFRLAYKFNNKGETRGASGSNGGIDVLGRGAGYQWLWTTYYQGGWFYDLNGVKREMIDGYQKDANNGVELTVKPEFVYTEGVPYLQLRHILHNPGNTAVTGQRFGASADVMIHTNDLASLVHTPYGAYMTDSLTDPSLELMFVCNSGSGIDPVDTLWLGEYDNAGRNHVEYIYVDSRLDVSGLDSAIGFSYQNIDLAPGQRKEFVVRFTLARTED